MYILKRSFYIYELNLHLFFSTVESCSVMKWSKPAKALPELKDSTFSSFGKSTVTKGHFEISTKTSYCQDSCSALWKGQPGERASRKSEKNLLKSSNLCSALQPKSWPSGRKKKNHKYTQDMKIYILIIYKMSFILIRYLHFSQDICGTKVSELKRCFIRLNQKILRKKTAKVLKSQKMLPKNKTSKTKKQEEEEEIFPARLS